MGRLSREDPVVFMLYIVSLIEQTGSLSLVNSAVYIVRVHNKVRCEGSGFTKRVVIRSWVSIWKWSKWWIARWIVARLAEHKEPLHLLLWCGKWPFPLRRVTLVTFTRQPCFARFPWFSFMGWLAPFVSRQFSFCWFPCSYLSGKMKEWPVLQRIVGFCSTLQYTPIVENCKPLPGIGKAMCHAHKATKWRIMKVLTRLSMHPSHRTASKIYKILWKGFSFVKFLLQWWINTREITMYLLFN